MTDRRAWSAPDVASLRRALAELFPREPDQRRFVADLGLPAGTIAFDASAENGWFSILQRARQTVGLDALLRHALDTDEGRDNAALRRIAEGACDGRAGTSGAPGARERDPTREGAPSANVPGQRPRREAAPATGARAPIAPHRILFLASNPDAARRLELGTEFRAVREELERSGRGGLFDLVLRPDLHLDDLRRSFNAVGPSIVHFGGHGGGAAGLLLHDKSVGTRLLDAGALRGLFALAAEPVRLAVLNACSSEAQARALVEVVDCVVCMSHAVEDAAACRFAAALYGALAAGRSVENAFAQGVWAMEHGAGGVPRAGPCGRDLEAPPRPGRASEGPPNAARLLVRPGVDAGAIVFGP